MARLWDLTAKDPAANPVVLRGHEDWVRALALLPTARKNAALMAAAAAIRASAGAIKSANTAGEWSNGDVLRPEPIHSANPPGELRGEIAFDHSKKAK